VCKVRRSDTVITVLKRKMEKVGEHKLAIYRPLGFGEETPSRVPNAIQRQA